MSKRARDPFAVAVLAFSLLLVALLLFLLAADVRKKTAGRPTAPFVPPGWVEPTFPPPSRN